MHYNEGINIPTKFNLFSAPRLRDEEQRGARERGDGRPLLPPVLQPGNNKGIFNQEEQQPASDQRNRSQATMPAE